MDTKRIFARFFKTSAGNEPVREWLKNQTDANKKSIGGDIAAVEWRWPLGLPLVRKPENAVISFYQKVWEMNNTAIGSTFENFLDEENIKEDVETNAVKKIIALQMQENLRKENISKAELAHRLDTSRAAVNRLLDPYNESITLLTLKKAASIMGKKLKLELV